VSRAAARFSETATGYVATMAPSLRPIAAEVVRRARLRPHDRVLDAGTGPGTAARLAVGEGRSVTGIDAAPAMLDIARDAVPDATFLEMDFGRLAFPHRAFDVVLAVHALLFADDPVAVLAEWRRVAVPTGRLSLSVPGPEERTPSAFYADVYRRFGVEPTVGYPTPDILAAWARDAGWEDVSTTSDPSTAIELPDEAAFRLWRSIGGRSPRQGRRRRAVGDDLTDAMLAATPIDGAGRYRVPFGTIYLTARA
jgi:ubiquinone/menaquinone biosynthesis C-methylase UbiE